MHEVAIKIKLFVLIAGLLLLLSGCGAVAAYHTNCASWQYRTANRQVCKSYSSNGHCSFWGSESYQEKYCAHWKTKEELDREKYGYSSTAYNETPNETAKVSKPKVPTSTLLRRANQASTSIQGEQSPGRAFLETRLEPFLCKIVSSDDIRGTLSTMGVGRVGKVGRGKYHTFFMYATGEFSGSMSWFDFGKKEQKAAFGIDVRENACPFSVDELVDWLSGIGLDVRLVNDISIYPTGTAIIGVPGIHLAPIGSDNPSYYDFDIRTQKSFTTNEINENIRVNWKDITTAKEILCRE